MNENHARLCPSPQWAAHLRDEVLPAATEWLRHRVRRLVAVERDAAAAADLRAKHAMDNVQVVHGDGTDVAFDDATFDSVGCFTMLHHVPTAALQDALLGEALRVLRPGGVLVGSDGVPSDGLACFHDGDTYNPVDPAAFADRLRGLGFERVSVNAGKWMTFRAHKPAVVS